MDDFTSIYDNADLAAARKKARVSFAIFVGFSLLFAAVCVCFLILYLYAGANVWLCGVINFVATVVHCWYAIAFFSVVYPPKRRDVTFFKSIENALIAAERGRFVGDGEERGSGTELCSLVFETGTGEKVFTVRAHKKPRLEVGRDYDLRFAGDRLLFYRAVER